jgi:FKBP-type peptidyl-prolyl cis-trans isomerase FkpA
VLIEYEGKLEDGTVFDTSAGKGPVPLLASQVIPGFAQALSQMQKGGHYRIRIPSKLAYGATPPQDGPIPPNADLNFDVRIVDIAPNAALMQGAPQQQ